MKGQQFKALDISLKPQLKPFYLQVQNKELSIDQY